MIALLIIPSLLPMGDGSMRYAKKWYKRLDSIQTVEQAVNDYPSIKYLNLTNEQWIVWTGQNSHGNPFGGTIVTHDSQGDTRVFFGHVCGAPRLGGESLEQVYTNIFRIPDRREIQIK